MKDVEKDKDKQNEKGITDTTKIQDFDDILDGLGGFGHLQRVIFILISLADIHGAFAMILPVFAGATPKWRCTRFSGINGTFNGTENNMLANDTFQLCYLNNHKCIETEFIDDFTSIVSQWNLTCDNKFVSTLITSVQMVGVFFGVAIFSQLSDTIGRKISYYTVFLALILPGFISAFSVSWQMYAVCRFFVGFGFGGIHCVNCIYTVELVGRKWRTLCGTIGFWALGIMILALMGHLIRDWRHLAIAVSISGLPYYATWWFVPESPRWLIQHGRFEEADVTMKKIAKSNKKDPVSIETLKQCAIAEEQEILLTRKYSYLDLFRTRLLIKKTIIQVLSWFTVFLTYYIMTFNMEKLAGNRYLNLFIGGLVDLPSMFATIFLCNWIGRRLSYILYMAICVVSAIGVIIIYVQDKVVAMGSVITALALAAKAGGLGASYVAQIYSAELFPTVIRNLGLGAGDMAARIAGMVAPQVVFLASFSEISPYIIVLILSLIVAPLNMLLPETKGRPLEDGLPPKKQKKSNNVAVTMEVNTHL